MQLGSTLGGMKGRPDIVWTERQETDISHLQVHSQNAHMPGTEAKMIRFNFMGDKNPRVWAMAAALQNLH